MQVDLQNIGKRFNREWIFKNISFIFENTSSTGIIGSNGSGKSTLLKIISAAELPTSGEILFKKGDQTIAHNDIYSSISFAAPYMDVAEELSCEELFDFHVKFATLQTGLSKEDFFQLIYLEESKTKFIKNFSSGMKQRLKLGFAICFQSSLLLLDEPCSNLDAKGIEMYQHLLTKFNTNRTTIIGSNDEKTELFSIQKKLNVLDYK